MLISGPEDVCAERASAAIRDQLRAIDPGLEISDLDAGEYETGSLLQRTAPSLFDEARLVRVTGLERAGDAFLSEAGAYVASPQPGATVLLRHTGTGRRGAKLLEAVRELGEGALEIPCPAIRRDADRLDFVAAEFRDARRPADPAAVRALVSAFGEDMGELAAACRQLLSDVPDRITEAAVTRYYGGRVEAGAFTVADAAISGRYGDALVALRRALASGADPVPIVAAIASKLRLMARVAGRRDPAATLATRLGVKDWQVDRARRDLAGWNERSLAGAIQACARADAEVKGASRNAAYAIERLVGTVAARGSEPTAAR